MLIVLNIISCCTFSGTLKQILLQNEGHPQISLLSNRRASYLTTYHLFRLWR